MGTVRTEKNKGKTMSGNSFSEFVVEDAALAWLERQGRLHADSWKANLYKTGDNSTSAIDSNACLATTQDYPAVKPQSRMRAAHDLI